MTDIRRKAAVYVAVDIGRLRIKPSRSNGNAASLYSLVPNSLSDSSLFCSDAFSENSFKSSGSEIWYAQGESNPCYRRERVSKWVAVLANLDLGPSCRFADKLPRLVRRECLAAIPATPPLANGANDR